MSFTTIVELEGGLRLTNRYEMRDVIDFMKMHRNRRRATPILPWLMDIAFEDKDYHFAHKSIEKMTIKKTIMD